MKIVNLTPHAITFIGENTTFTVEPSENLARVAAKTVPTGQTINDIPVTATSYSEVSGLPEQEPDTILLVSSIVAARCKERADVFIPNESVRDSEGRIIGCKSFGHV